jgi:hypothetical protein
MRWLKKHLPDPEKMRDHSSLRWLGPVAHAPDLWRFNRRSVAGGVAVGFFFAFIIPLGQFLGAALAALVLRVNLPVAMTSTLITNPFTYAPWYYLAYRIGTALLGAPATDNAQPAPAEPVAAGMGGIVEGFQALMAMGQPLVVGLLVLAVVFAVAGYFLVQAMWRLPAYLRLQRRQARR